MTFVADADSPEGTITNSPQPDRPLRRKGVIRTIQIGSAAVAIISVLTLIWQEQLIPVLAVIAILGLAVFIWSSNWWKVRRRLAAAVAVDLLFILAYSWSLGDSIHLVVQTTQTGYSADLGNNLGLLDLPSHPAGRIGLYLPTHQDNKMTAAGQATLPRQADTPLTWLGTLLRYVTPGPAWANLKLVEYQRTGTRVFYPKNLEGRGKWSHNVRGELIGPPGVPGFLPERPTGTFVLSVDLMRPEGLQGLLVGVNKANRGYMFGVRMDVRQAWWHTWTRTGVGPWTGQGATVFDLENAEMIKRLLRLALPSVILAMLILVSSVPVYGLAALLIQWVRREGPWTHQVPMGQDTNWARLSVVVAGAAVAASAVIMAWISAVVYRGIPNVQDAVAYFFQAKTLASARLYDPAPALPSFFSQQFILVYHDHWFGKYPPGWPLFLAVGIMVHLPWLVGPLMSAASLAFVYLIGRELYGWKVAILATLLGLSSPFWLFLGASYYPHAASGLLLVAFVYLLIRWDRRQPRTRGTTWRLTLRDARLLIPAGLLFGTTFITRELDALALAFPFVVVFLRRPLALFWAAVGAILPASLYLMYNRLVTGAFLTNAYTIERPFDRLGFGPHVGGPRPYSANFTFARGLWNVSYDLAHLESGLFGWPYFLALAVVAVPFIVGRAKRWDWIFAASVLCLIGAYVFYFADGVWFTFPRYWYVSVPWLCLLTARGLQEIYRWPLWIGIRLPRSRVAAAIPPVALAMVLLLYELNVYFPATSRLISSYGAGHLTAITAVDRAALHNALVFQVQNRTRWWPYGGVLTENAPLLDGNIVWARDEGPRDVRLMALYPNRAYYRLTNGQLTRIYPPPGT